VFQPETLVDVPWLADLLDKPDDAAWPRWMTPPHPDAVGSYGQEVEEWVEEQHGTRWRWWQRLATRRQLEHDVEGRLVWETVVESTPRRGGKSTRIVGLATWRMAHPEIFGEIQTVIHCGSDMPICREIQRRSWRWAEEVAGWTVTRSNGKESMETLTGDRWLVRSENGVYGYDCSFGIVDEGWDVAPMVIDEGLEPALLEREMPQLHLTSTAHRRATPLMRRRIAAALSGMGEDWTTLLMVWAADPDDDIGEESTWRSASPHWTEQRRRMISGKYERAMRGEADPEADDPDPIEGFKAQYLNLWPSPTQAKPPTGESVVTEAEWESANSYVRGPETPSVTAVEAWFQQGAALVTATQLADGRVGVSSVTFPEVSSAIAAAQASGASQVLVAKSLAVGVPGVTPVGGTTRQAVLDLRRFIDDGVLTHDGSPELAQQVLALRTVASSDGPRLVSKGRADAVKATSWAVAAAQQAVEPSQIF